MFALLALGGDIGCSFGPWLTGTVSDAVMNMYFKTPYLQGIATGAGLDAEQLGLRCGFLAASAFPLLMILGVVVLSKAGKRINEKI
ncbi:MAG: hypothetical protein IKL24_02535 [Clostridia bacterium]|nr:hypothetical protein [Clostridia bacterium]